MRWVEHIARVGGMRNTYASWVGTPERTMPLERPTLRWEDNIKMNLNEILYEGVNSIHLPQDRGLWPAFENMITDLRVL
jgi:hypothetical protein